MSSLFKNSQTTPNSETSQIEPYAFLLSAYVACLIIAQVLATKFTTLQIPGIGTLTFTGGEIAYALTFLFTDVIAEIYGKRRAAITVICGLGANILVLALIRITLILPTADFADDTAFRAVVGATSRITIASIIAFVISQSHDVWMYHLVRRWTNERHMWLRNNVSTAISQAIDTTIFTMLAFYGVAPVIPLIVGQLTIKWILAAVDTPIAYLLVWYIRDRQKKVAVQTIG